MQSLKFVDIDHWQEWGWLQFSSYGETPEEALAALERGIIETLAVGGQLEERRSQLTYGRRSYDAAWKVSDLVQPQLFSRRHS